jgi:hypothetical protein
MEHSIRRRKSHSKSQKKQSKRISRSYVVTPEVDLIADLALNVLYVLTSHDLLESIID